MSRLDNAVASKHLGQKSDYAEQYDPTLLVAVPRQPNRDNIGVDGKNTPWKYAYDVWVAYEISSLLANGQPFSAIAKIVYDGNSECIVESKSLKLYFNSFNQTRSPECSVPRAYDRLKEVIEKDLSELLKTNVRVGLFSSHHKYYHSLPLEQYLMTGQGSLANFTPIDGLWGEFRDNNYTKYTEDKTLLGEAFNGEYEDLTTLHTSNLFSRCQITNQPDHGDLFIGYRGKKHVPDPNISAYVTSLRGHSCFHEPTVETIFKHLYDLIDPKYLIVAALYTRRGGISIGPIRSTHDQLIPFNVINHQIAHTKLPRE